MDIVAEDGVETIVTARHLPRLKRYWDSVVESSASPAAAAREFKRAAASGNLLARAAYAVCQIEEFGISENIEKAVKDLKFVADEGLIEGEVIYGLILTTPEANLPKEGGKYLKRAAEKKDPMAEYEYGLYLVNWSRKANRIEEAVEYFERSARQGNVMGQLALGVCFLFGAGVREDARKALEYFTEWAEKGDPAALFLCGIVHQRAQDLRTAAKYFKASARRGLSFGQASYAWMRENGIGVKQDLGSACKYYKKAGKQDHEEAAARAKRCKSRGGL